jgi:serine/threonine protein kinase
VFLSDVGLAVLTQSFNPRHDNPIFTAPELTKTKKESKEADIWAFGVVLYLCIALVVKESPFK